MLNPDGMKWIFLRLGVFSDLKLDNFDTLIDIRDVPELNTHTVSIYIIEYCCKLILDLFR